MSDFSSRRPKSSRLASASQASLAEVAASAGEALGQISASDAAAERRQETSTIAVAEDGSSAITQQVSSHLVTKEINEEQRTAQIAPAMREAMLADAMLETDDRAQLNELRRVLLGNQPERIAHLEYRLNDHTGRVTELSQILPDAIRARNQQDEALNFALQPNIGPLLKRSIQQDPASVIEAITPIIGPIIRQAIAKALSEFVQSIDETMKYSFSAQGMKWRWEAISTGRSFPEVVMYHTLLYRVEQALLVHKQTGLLLQHVTLPGVTSKDADMISGLLTAINDFARESFKTDEHQHLLKLDYGNLEVWIEGGTTPVDLAYLAVVINGNAPESLRTQVLLPALERIHLKHHALLRDFTGVTTPFDETQPMLESCLQSQSRGQATLSEQPPQGLRLPPTVAVPLAVFALLLLTWGFFVLRAQWAWQRYLRALEQDPGLVVTEQARRNNWRLENRFFVEGLRDPLARDPQEILRGVPQLDPASVTQRWKPFYSLDAAYVLQRATRVLEPPASVKLDVRDGALLVHGTATQQWLNTARQLVRGLPGVQRLDESGLLDERATELLRVKDALEREQLLFERGTAKLTGITEKKWRTIVKQLQVTLALAQSLGQVVRLEIIGNADHSGPPEFNEQLSLQRAEQVQAELVRRGIPARHLQATRAGHVAAEATSGVPVAPDPYEGRNVTFKLIVRP